MSDFTKVSDILSPETQTPSGTNAIALEDVLEKTRQIGLVDDEIVEVVLATHISKEVQKENPI